MRLLSEHHSFTGMQRDFNVLKHPPTFLYNAKNIRLTAREDDTLLAVSNEKGTINTKLTIEGEYLGSCKLNNYLVIFTHDKNKEYKDYIYRIDLEDEVLVVLYNGNLGFKNPIDAVGNYENENIQKVYWVDGENQPRVINIAGGVKTRTALYASDTSFDFIPKLKLQEEVKVKKILGTGEFPAGVIQYAFTYYNKWGQESNIFHTTPLQYISSKGRAGSPEEKIANAFKISITNLDLENFEYLRIYSILRTSLNGTPLVKRVQDIKVLGNRFTFDKDNIISNSQYYLIENGPTKIGISLDGGTSYVNNISPVVTTIEEAWNKDYIPGNRNQENKESPIQEWNKYILGTFSESKDFLPDVYIFNKKDYPLLTLKLGDTYYSWGDNDSTDRIYLGKRAISNDAYTWIIVGEKYSNKTVSSIASGDALAKTSGVEYIDTGTSGDIIDPTELLYKGGESISASSIAVLDNTLFLGDIQIKRDNPNIKDALLNTSSSITSCTYERSYLVDGKEMPYIDTLNSEDDYPGATAFKSREYYRLGIQFQHETGKWSEPYWLGDKKCENNSSITDGNKVLTAGFKYTLSNTNIIDTLKNAGYLKARPVFAYPSANDRTILCQGVLSPTVYRNRDRFMNSKNNEEGNGAIYAQSSWLFRTYLPPSSDKGLKGNNVGKVSWNDELYSQYNENIYDNILSPYIFSTEISGIFDEANTYRVDTKFVTLHSPDLIFDDSFSSTDFSLCGIHQIGTTSIASTYSDIDIRTSSDTIGSSAGGFLHKSVKSDGHYSLVSGLFYEDKIVDDVDGTPPYLPYKDDTGSIQKWFVSLWQRNGSLNNDVNRENRSAQLQRKVISNFKFCDNVSANFGGAINSYKAKGITLFNDDQVSIVKSGDKIYMGNINTMVTPTLPSPHYFNGNFAQEEKEGVAEDFIYWKLDRSFNSENATSPGIYLYSKDVNNKWVWDGKQSDVGNIVRSLVSWRDGISIKYKSTPHLVASVDGYSEFAVSDSLVLVEVQRQHDENTMFGGTSDDAMKAATWIPCGPAVNITNNTTLEYKWGDTYFQRFDCLKTYPFTKEDVNQVVEIASFMVETRINLGGRYDRNKGQISNLNVSPENFNLINPVYSQPDNFFSYRILDSDYYNINSFPNQITWSKAKQSGAEIDLWTNITMASTYDVDGSKGSIKALKTWKDNLYCFQDKGISNILFNSRVQIPVSDGVPIELGNSNKLEGHRYITEGYGCSNKELIKSCNSGLYFIDDTTNHLIYIGDGIRDVSMNNNMSSWFNNNSINRIEYDSRYSDIYLVREDGALCFSETLGQFTSFFDYGDISFIESYKNKVFTLKDNSLHKMFEGNYNYFFDNYKPWEFTFISNGSNNNTQDLSKIFSNIDYRMDVSEEGKYKPDKTLSYIKVEDGYQDTGKCPLNRLKSLDNYKSYHYKESNLQKKFRTWGIQIPRHKDNMDRIRDNWCKITLGSNSEENSRAVLYDLNVQYYI